MDRTSSRALPGVVPADSVGSIDRTREQLRKKGSPAGGPTWATGRAGSGRPWLLALWILCFAGAATLLPDAPLWVRTGAQVVSLAAFTVLVGWWALAGFAGYEHMAGFRIIRRTHAQKPVRWLWLALAISAIGLLGLQLGYKSVLVVVLVALATSVALVLLFLRWFSLFATLSMVGVAIGVAALIVVQSVATGFQHEFERRVLGVYAHINVTRSFGISEYRRFESYLRTLPGVTGASPFVYHGMALAPDVGGRSGDVPRASVLVKGIEPSTAAQVIDLAEHLARGRGNAQLGALTTDLELEPVADRPDERLPQVIVDTPDPRGPGAHAQAQSRWETLAARRRASVDDDFDDDDWPTLEDASGVAAANPSLPTMFVGSALARRLELDVGDQVMLVDPAGAFDGSRTPKFRRYNVAGVFRAGFQEYDSQLIYVHIKELQYFKYRGRDIVSGIDLRLDDAYEAPQIEQRLEQTLGTDEYSILEWQRLNANLFQSIRTQKSILTVILSLVSTVAGFNVLAALWTMVVLRTPEIAILMSMGATDAGVARIFQFAGMSIGSFGALAGVVLGLVLSRLVELYGYTLDPEVYFIERLPVEYDPVQILVILAMTMAICFVATLPPALRAAKLRPVEGLRYE